MDTKEAGRRGGLARKLALTPARRKEIAILAGRAGKGIKRPRNLATKNNSR